MVLTAEPLSPGRRGASAPLVSLLASEQAGYITGEAIGIDGGLGLSTLTLGGERAG